MALAVLLVSCGPPAAAPQQPDVAVGKSPAETAVANAPRPTGRRPSAEISKHWSLPGRLELSLYVDAEGLNKTPFVETSLANVLSARNGIDPCVRDAVAAMKEGLVGSDGKRGLVVVRFDPGAAMAACLEKTAKLAKHEVPGADAAFLDRGKVIAIRGGLLVMGDEDVVAAALAGKATPPPDDLVLGKDEYIALHFGDPEKKLAGNGSLVVAPERVRFEIAADMPAPLAARFEKQFAGASTDPNMRAFADAVSLRRDGGKITFALEVAGTTEEQGRKIAGIAESAIQGVRAYLTAAKQAEARNTISFLAKSLVADWERDDAKAPRVKRKLVSFPAVPKTVPRGTKVQTSSTDWASWSALHFEMAAPQYYQYEIRAAKDGESADVVARGDLNGDGKTSLFKTTLKIDRKTQTLVIPPKIDEENPDE